MRNASTIVLLFLSSSVPWAFLNLYHLIFSFESPSHSRQHSDEQHSFSPPLTEEVSADFPYYLDHGLIVARVQNAASNTTATPASGEDENISDLNDSITSDDTNNNAATGNQTKTMIGQSLSQISRTTILEKMKISAEHLEASVPSWLMEYFGWHRQQLNQLNKTNWKKSRFLILRCSRRDKRCGGTSDRLKPLPFYLRLAYESQRIFFIRWELPHKLEEFLQPTIHFNWSVPAYMEKRLNSQADHKHSHWKKKPHLYMHEMYHFDELYENAMAQQPAVMESRKQTDDGCERHYLNLTNYTETYQDVYHGMFRATFQPSPGVAALVDYALHRMDNLVPGEYSAAHVRNFYKRPMYKVSKELQTGNAINAVNCASQLHPGDPIYFASDSGSSVKAVQEYATANKYPIHSNTFIESTHNSTAAGASVTKADPLHLDFAGRGNKTWPVSAFYDTFVDLLLLGNARCISYGEGGYGRFASLLSFDPNCTSVNAERVGRLPSPLPCEWMQ